VLIKSINARYNEKHRLKWENWREKKNDKKIEKKKRLLIWTPSYFGDLGWDNRIEINLSRYYENKPKKQDFIGTMTRGEENLNKTFWMS